MVFTVRTYATTAPDDPVSADAALATDQNLRSILATKT
jgi:hypothetical protein